ENHLACVGGGPSRDGGESTARQRGHPPARVGARRRARTRVDHPGRATRRARGPERTGSQGVRPLRQGPLVQCVCAPERRARGLRWARSEERRVGKECRGARAQRRYKKKKYVATPRSTT